MWMTGSRSALGGDRDGTPGCVWASGEGDKYLDVSSGSAVFTITQAMLDSDTFTFELYLEQEGEGVAFIMLAFPDAEPDEEPPFDTVAEAVAAGGNCEGLGCLAHSPIAIDPNVMLVYETGETEGNFGVSLRYEPPPGATITVTVDPNNGGPSEDFTLLGSTDPNGSIALTFNTGNWDVPQTVVFKAIDDDISDDLPELLEEHTILLVSSYPGHSTDVNFVGENNVTATVVDNDLPPGETLYNGIVLPYTWPPQYPSIPYEPMPVPYLDNPPAVVPIDVGRQFFVDDFLVETTTMTRTFHLPEFHASNPVIQADRTWEAYAIPSSGGAWYDPDDSLFKLWYSCHDGVINDQEGGLGPVSLATSLDGVNWDKPNYGSGKNIVLDVTHDSSVIWMDQNAVAGERFKWFATEYFGMQGDDPIWKLCYRISADGISWSAPQGTPQSVWGDRTTALYNPFRDVWVCSQRLEILPEDYRVRAYVEGTSAANLMSKIKYCQKDQVEGEYVYWVGADPCDPKHPWEGDPPDAQLYNLDAAPYESVMLGLFSVFQGDPGHKNIISLGFSRDGFHWDRPDRRPFCFDPRGEAPLEPLQESSDIQSAAGGPLIVGDKLYFYSKYWPGGEGFTNLHVLRRDGFASMDAGPSAETLTTRPVTFQGKYLFVNTDCPSGELKVEVLNEASEVISPFTLANCDAISSDTTCKQVTWDPNDDLSALQGQSTRFRFTLTDGSLYAFWVSPDASGASYGYVAGGGPGFTGPTDTVGLHCGGANLDDNIEINTADLVIIAAHWMFDCTAPDWCGGADMDPVVEDRGQVNLVDFAIFALYWLETGCI